MKIICPCPELFSKKGLKILTDNKLFNCKFVKMKQKKFNKIVSNYDVVLTRFNHKIKFRKNIKFIISPTTGLDHIDKKFFNSQTKIISLKRDNFFLKKINATSEYTVYLILKRFRAYKDKFHLNREIKDKNIGIIGYGRIGKKVLKVFRALEAKVYYYDKTYSTISLIKMFKTCDIISIHIPLDGNINFINNSHFKHLKENSILINTSRGNIINEKQLYNFTTKKKFIYITDVIGEFLESKFNQKKKLQNIFYSKHVAGLTRESVEKTDLRVISKFLKIINL